MAKRKGTASKPKPKSKPGSKPEGKPTDPAAAWVRRVAQDVWPQERDFMERPERYRYVRKLLPETGCVFCGLSKVEPSVDSLVLARDELTQVVMNKYPYNTGHLLITPLVHVGSLTDLDDRTLAKIAWWQRRTVEILKKALGCGGFNLGLNQGAVAGAGIPDHLHWHVVPRWGGDVNFFPLIAETKVLPQTLEQTYTKLRPFFEGES